MAQKTRGGTVLKNNIGRCWSCFVCVIISSISIANASETKILKVCYDQWPPMTIFPTHDAPLRGVVIDMLAQVYSAHGYTIEYYEVPLARGLDMVTNGLCDMLPEFLDSKQADNAFVYASEPTFEYPSAFVVRKDDPWHYNGIKSIEGKRIATGQGWDYSSMSLEYQHYLDNPDNAHFVEVIAGDDDVVERVLMMIKGERVDLYADNALVLQHVLNRNNLNSALKIVQPGLENKLVEMPIFSNKIPSEKRQRLISIWNEGRRALKGQQEQIILKKYNVMF
ncbi:amino acid ABC transporter [Pseudoalteromonas tunicata]|jgi:polar amino acid transport system substrate-binding protein|nr:amino acid ABC transporter [Pseudoalteromonas tunicata]